MATELIGIVTTALVGAVVTDNSVVKLSIGQIEKDEFRQLKQVFDNLGGKWKGGKVGGFVFDPKQHSNLQAVIREVAKSGKMPEANQYSYFGTRQRVVESLFVLINIDNYVDWKHRPVKFLEPSAGVGAIADMVQAKLSNVEITIVELDDFRCQRLEQKGYEPHQSDFRDWQTDQRFDLIVMNPPFNDLECVDHALRAYELLDRDGSMTCILPEMILKRVEVKKVAKLLDLVNRQGFWEELDPNSFAPETTVDTIGIVIHRCNLEQASSESVVDAVLITLNCDHNFNKELWSMKAKEPGQQARAEISRLIDCYMKSNPHAFYVLSDEERESLIDYYESTRFGQE